MKWRGRRGSQNIEDRRGGRRAASRGGQMGIVGMVIVLALGYFLGIDVTPLLNGGGSSVTTSAGGGDVTEADREAGQFVSVVLADTEEIWSELFRTQLGRQYTPSKLVLFTGNTQSPCGGASGATGPFYCPADRKAYLDTNFFVTMQRKLGAGGDFAAAYVVAHEVAHHVQNELGILPEANRARQAMSERDSNMVSVRIELQADCYSGIWARAAEEKFQSLEAGDLREALNAAKAIGDDTLQRNAGRRPMPHTFTHGTSEQRMRWFARGYETGSILDCDTFSTNNL